jgi:hypothetical protein
MANGRPGARRRYDYDAAFAYYYGLGKSRSLAAVRAEFGMAQRSLERICSKERWLERVAAFDAEAAKKAAKIMVRERALRIADTLRIIDATRTKFAGQLKVADFRLTGSDFVGLMKLEALLEGDPTDRVQVGEVQQIIAVILSGVSVFIAADKRDEFLAWLEEVKPQLAIESAAA